MRIGITLKKSAYTPEAYAYETYLKERGHQVQLDYTLDPNNDINLNFMGVIPFWRKKEGRAVEIHEYQSLSTPPYASFKNLVKKVVNEKPQGRIFLNEFVCKGFDFKDDIPFICRDMGVDEALFQKPNSNPDYDILYCGSITGRVGLIDVLLSLSKKYKIIIVGNVSEYESTLLNNNNITLLGVVPRHQLPEIYKNARFGLNFTPDIYPFNIQTSTKTLEYLASGLGVISNRYHWSEAFFKDLKYTPLWIDNNFSIDNYSHINLDVSHFSWSNILLNCNFEKFIMSVVDE